MSILRPRVIKSAGEPIALNLTTTRLTFTVAKATGRWARSVGTQGTAELTLVTQGPSPLNPSLMSTSQGTFALVLTRAWGMATIRDKMGHSP